MCGLPCKRGLLSVNEDVMRNTPLLDFHHHGNITADEERDIRHILDECYQHFGHGLPERVEIRLFEGPALLGGFLQAEKAQLGIKTLGDEAFICSHDAWHGFPRVLICMERLSSLPVAAQRGALRHEAAHTVLHGSLACYVVRIPPDCVELARAKDIQAEHLQQVLYYCATAVKDFEVTRLLLHHGYQECQLAFAQFHFLPSDEDRLAWFLAKGNPLGRLLFFAGQLKVLLLGLPLETAGLLQIDSYVDSMLGYLKPDERRHLLDLARSTAEHLGSDTHDNICLALRVVLN
jgi:hypothetical protein